ncbi:MAG: acetamidase/formamidase family protein [Crenarchaeota archaeon]|nr:acetamidase/formamidase family protein [Thermoproteota archaeon]MCR8501500.1 acetamidase/formamidase family protein [Thermoproteota archaeon]
MIFVSSDKHIFSFGPDLEPVAYAKPGDIICFETLDCFAGQLTSEIQSIANIDLTRANPATGPVFIEGAEPGDTLKIEILDIRVSKTGVVVALPGFGLLGDKLRDERIRICRIEDGFVYFTVKDSSRPVKIRLPYKPMVGVIGVAYSKKVPSTIPGVHGGNMDTKLITRGTAVYLPVFKEGGLLAVGDVHAVMADGEMCATGCEVSGEVVVRVDVIKGCSVQWPIIEAEDAIYIIVSKESLEEAFYEASNAAARAISCSLSLEFEDAYMIAGLIVDLQVSQVVNVVKTVRARIPKEFASITQILEALNNK